MQLPDADVLRDELGLLVEAVDATEEHPAESGRWTAFARDGSVVELTWTDLHQAVEVRVRRDAAVLATLYRETVRQVSANASDGVVHLHVVTASKGVHADLLVHVGDGVTIEDRLFEASAC